jgi:hypothetical protein
VLCRSVLAVAAAVSECESTEFQRTVRTDRRTQLCTERDTLVIDRSFLLLKNSDFRQQLRLLLAQCVNLFVGLFQARAGCGLSVDAAL